jgi:hypothetical protein
VEVAYWAYTVETIAEGGEGGGLREEHEETVQTFEKIRILFRFK